VSRSRLRTSFGRGVKTGVTVSFPTGQRRSPTSATFRSPTPRRPTRSTPSSRPA
jgi:hypothetical protein